MARSGQGYLGMIRRRRGMTQDELSAIPGNAFSPDYYPGLTGGDFGILDRPQAPFGLTPIQGPGMPSWQSPTPPAGPLQARLAKPLPPALSMPQAQIPALSGPAAPDTMGSLLNSPDHIPGEVGAAIPPGLMQMGQPQTIQQTPLEDPYAIKDAGEAPPVVATATRLSPWDGMSQFPAYTPPDMSAAQQQPTQTHVDQQNGFGTPLSLSLLSAGLGILANNTGHYGQAGPAIGKGGLIGLGTFQQLQQQQIMNDQAKAKMAMEQARNDAYLQQVKGQIMAQDRANKNDLIRSQLVDAFQNASSTTERQKAQENLAAFDKQSAAIMRNEQPKMEWVALSNPDGTPKLSPSGEQIYQQQLRNPVTGDVQIVAPAALKSGMKINVLPENKAQTVLAGKSAEQVAESGKAAISARNFASQMSVLKNLMSDYEGGPIDAMKATLGKYFTGIDSLKDAASINSVVNSQALMASKEFKMPGSTSDYEQHLYLSAIPTMMWNRAGREILASLADKLATRRAILAKFEMSQLKENGYVDPVAMDDYSKQLGPIFTSDETNQLIAASKAKSSEKSGGFSSRIGPNPSSKPWEREWQN